MHAPRPLHRQRRPHFRGAPSAEAERLLILQAKRRQEQARVRLMNLEVARRALLLVGVVAAVGIVLLRLATGADLGETDLGLSILAAALGMLQRS
jgi:hypothetical protein